MPIDYDPLLAKLAVWSGTRETAIARMLRALREYDVAGIHTNITFFRQILEDEEFRAGRLHTGFVDEFLARRKPFEPPSDLEAIAALVAAYHSAQGGVRARESRRRRAAAGSISAARRCCDEVRSRSPGGLAKSTWMRDGRRQIAAVEPGVYSVLQNGRSYEARIEQSDGARDRLHRWPPLRG